MNATTLLNHLCMKCKYKPMIIMFILKCRMTLNFVCTHSVQIGLRLLTSSRDDIRVLNLHSATNMQKHCSLHFISYRRRSLNRRKWNFRLKINYPSYIYVFIEWRTGISYAHIYDQLQEAGFEDGHSKMTARVSGGGFNGSPMDRLLFLMTRH